MPGRDDRDLLIDAVREAGRVAQRYFGQKPEVWDKGGGAGPVTEADLAVDQMLKAELMAARPDHGWLSEESADTIERQSAERVFIVDPIDGTRSFISGDNNWAHSVAIAERGEIVAAAVYLPMRDRLYCATKGDGATLNGVPLVTAGRRDLEGATVLTTRTNLKPEHWSGAVPNFVHKFRPSLAYRMALVAEGRYDAMITLRQTWEWDVAAGTLLVTEAGGEVADRQGQAPRFNNVTPSLDGLVAGCPLITRGIVERLHRRAD